MVSGRKRGKVVKSVLVLGSELTFRSCSRGSCDSFSVMVHRTYDAGARSATPDNRMSASYSSLMNLSAANAAMVPSAIAVVRYR